ncbi:MAG: nodulation protein NfeD [Syntrophomonadaceae bacterium]|nr:nodulation protein NfeD [Syntrophomonadaceae bacterium]
MEKPMRCLWILTIIALILIPAAFLQEAKANPAPVVYSIQVNDMVTSGTAAYINRAIEQAGKNHAEALVIILNTPGGLLSSTLDIVEAISNASVPVITYVSPRGAISASAGTYILLSGHLAAMAPGTACGAAMPVRISSLGKYQAADQKTINLMAEHMKSIAEERSRPADLARRFVIENLSLGNRDALMLGVIDFEASDLSDLLIKADGYNVQTKSVQHTLRTAGASMESLDMNSRERLIHHISNPMLALFLIIIGLYGLIFAFHSPGFLLPEVLGSISLLLGLYGIGLFAINLTAGLLIILGLGLLIAEAYTPAWGILGLGGIASLVLGILLFPVEPLLPVSWWSSFRFMAVGIGVVGAALLSIILSGIWRIRRIKPIHGVMEFADRRGLVVQALQPRGLVRIQGEIWQAQSLDGRDIAIGSKVKIIKKEGLYIMVEPIPDSEND